MTVTENKNSKSSYAVSCKVDMKAPHNMSKKAPVKTISRGLAAVLKKPPRPPTPPCMSLKYCYKYPDRTVTGKLVRPCPSQCPPNPWWYHKDNEYWEMEMEHVPKGDPIDIAKRDCIFKLQTKMDPNCLYAREEFDVFQIFMKQSGQKLFETLKDPVSFQKHAERFPFMRDYDYDYMERYHLASQSYSASIRSYQHYSMTG
jgi:hypothetical protein